MKRTPIRDRRQRKARGNGTRSTILISALVVVAVLGVLAFATPFAFAFAAYGYASSALNSINVTSHEATFQTSRIYDRNGKLLYEFVDPRAGKRTVVPLSKIPESLRDATIAIEDKTFYTNPGFNVQSLLRAAYDDVVNHRVVSGASTITQQLVKTVYLTPDPTIQRKLQEIAISYTLSKEKSKDQILEMYLNDIYYGNEAYGIEAAAESYFGKSAMQLDLAEASLLAGLPQSPSDYDPLQNFKGAKARQLEVLNAMATEGYITPNQAAGAYDEPLKFAQQRSDIQAPHFVFYVRDLLEKKYGAQYLYEAGLNIKTTLDLNLQNEAQKIVSDQIDKLPKSKNVNNGALVAIDPRTGEILAMVGSKNYNEESPDGTMDGKFNAATALLQPGSSFKPFAYVTDFEKGRTPATMVDDAKVTKEFPNFDGTYYQPKNYDLKYHGWITLRTALANSLNVPAVKVLKDATIPATLQTAHAMGITSINDPSQVGLSLVLGGNGVTLLDMTSAYGVFANQGARVPDTAILSITDSTGKVIEKYTPPPPEQVLKPEYAYLITSILSDDNARAMEFGVHSVLQLDRPAAVKTGTTELFSANWTVGYTPSLAVGVWVGNSNHAPMENIIGIDGAGPIWHDFMEYALKSTPVQDFPKPANIVTERISQYTGLPTFGGPGSYEEVFVKGTEPRPGGPAQVVGDHPGTLPPTTPYRPYQPPRTALPASASPTPAASPASSPQPASPPASAAASPLPPAPSKPPNGPAPPGQQKNGGKPGKG